MQTSLKKIFQMTRLSILICFCCSMFFSCGNSGPQYILIETDFGNMKVELYDSTPNHRDNMIKLANQGFYNDLLFHRVMNNFMIQGGDPTSRNSPSGSPLGSGDPGYTLDAEIGAPHFKGVIAAARTPDAGNPEKKSNGSQFYIVHGGLQTDAFLNSMEQQKGFQYNETQRSIYKTKGGYPSLDMDYTAFGEVVEGLDVIDKIAAVQTDPRNRPMQDVKMKISVAN